MTKVFAPASSANLGPGFDVMGLALTRHSWASDVSPDDDPSGADFPLEADPCGPDHIARIAYEAAGGTEPIWFGFGFPPGRGLGFSASSRAAGAVLAFLQQGLPLEEAQRRGYDVVSQLEGHGDNAAPAVFGGIHVVAGTHQRRLSATLPWDLLCWVPVSETTPTDENRARMTVHVNRTDAVFNLGRLGLFMAALYEHDDTLLRAATEDRLHQPERFAAAPNSLAALEAALEAGALGGWLSGSGPTVAIVAANGACEQIKSAMPAGGSLLQLSLDQAGATTVAPAVA